MKVSTTQPYKIVYAIFQHEYLGYLIESFVVQCNSKGNLTLQYQNISSKNVVEFHKGLDQKDVQLVQLMDSIQQDYIIHRFYKKKITREDFFLKIYAQPNADPGLRDTIEEYLNQQKAKIIELLDDKLLYEMGSDGNPTWKRIQKLNDKASILFHFRKNQDNTHYFPTIQLKGKKLEFLKNGTALIGNQPAWMLYDGQLFTFRKAVDGKKLKPFLNRKFILIPKKIEEEYYQNFVAPLIEAFDVYAKGFEIVKADEQAKAQLFFTLLDKGEDEETVVFEVKFSYGKFVLDGSNNKYVGVKMEKEGGQFTFYRIKRDVSFEGSVIDLLIKSGLPLENNKVEWTKDEAFNWLNQQDEAFWKEIELTQKESKTRYFMGKSSIEVSIKENNDWFDIHANVQFGTYQLPFLEIRKYIKKGMREFTLPNGEVAVIPSSWFTKYSELFHFLDDSSSPKLYKQHFQIVEALDQQKDAKVEINKRLLSLNNFDSIKDYPIPEDFVGELRQYQKAGYNWMNFLKEYALGGCLADDMGLGKTIQTLAILQSEIANGGSTPNLIVVPTSLIYNWEAEAEKFTPNLKVISYTGFNRAAYLPEFASYDLIFTSYGILRRDIDILKKMAFNYIVLDEAQVIKNPETSISKAVNQLQSNYKLILTGTPLENSTMDLWSQMNFINPGLLGSKSFFKREYANPIEKNNNEEKLKKLQHLIKPFILRRHKSQVARELPEKTENILYCKMTEEQEQLYEQVKSSYRDQILSHIEKEGVAKSQFILLQGLTKLRQIANHPRLMDEAYDGGSGKMENILHQLEMLIEKNHKVLIFSQFVKHLDLVKHFLHHNKTPFTYLDGTTKDRKSVVESFQNDDQIKVFLISLKAGGVGLNLTAADYVFILDPWWNPAAENQAVDRAYRIGQTKNVFSYKFITKGTVEEKILSLQKRKQKLATELISIEEKYSKSLDKNDIMMLLE